jgi:hypothetical protein
MDEWLAESLFKYQTQHIQAGGPSSGQDWLAAKDVSDRIAKRCGFRYKLSTRAIILISESKQCAYEGTPREKMIGGFIRRCKKNRGDYRHFREQGPRTFSQWFKDTKDLLLEMGRAWTDIHQNVVPHY